MRLAPTLTRVLPVALALLLITSGSASPLRAQTTHKIGVSGRESWNEHIRLSPEAADRAVAALTRALQPYRNVVFQIWNEHNDRVLEHLETIKALDPSRLVTNSPGYGGDLGERQEDEALDFLSPHTSRSGPHWETAPREIALLLQKYGKPVVDDEPARSGIARFGGPSGETSPFDQILHIYNVRKEGGYVVYHHDMFSDRVRL